MNPRAQPLTGEPLREMPEGMVEYDCRSAIRDLIRLYGFEKAREMVAFYIMDEAERKLRNG